MRVRWAPSILRLEFALRFLPFLVLLPLTASHEEERGDRATDGEDAQRDTDANAGLSTTAHTTTTTATRITATPIRRSSISISSSSSSIPRRQRRRSGPDAPSARGLDDAAPAHVVHPSLGGFEVVRDGELALARVGVGPGRVGRPRERQPLPVDVADLVQAVVGPDVEHAARVLLVLGHGERLGLAVPRRQRPRRRRRRVVQLEGARRRRVRRVRVEGFRVAFVG